MRGQGAVVGAAVEGAAGGAAIVAPSQCSSALPSLIRHMSNQVVVYVFALSRGSGRSLTYETTTRSFSATTATTLVFQLFRSGMGALGRLPKKLTTGSRPDAT